MSIEVGRVVAGSRESRSHVAIIAIIIFDITLTLIAGLLAITIWN